MTTIAAIINRREETEKLKRELNFIELDRDLLEAE